MELAAFDGAPTFNDIRRLHGSKAIGTSGRTPHRFLSSSGSNFARTHTANDGVQRTERGRSGRVGRAEEGERTKTSSRSRSGRTRRYHRVIAITLTVCREIDRRERLRRDHSATDAGGFASVARTCDQLYTRRLHARWACGRASGAPSCRLAASSSRQAPLLLCLPARTGRQEISINSSMVVVGRETPVPLPAILYSLNTGRAHAQPPVLTVGFELFFPAFRECSHAAAGGPLIREGNSCVGSWYCRGELGEGVYCLVCWFWLWLLGGEMIFRF